MNNTKLKWFFIGFCTACLLLMLIITGSAIAQDGDTTLYHPLNKDTIVMMVFDKHCIDSINLDYKNRYGYCPPKELKYIRVTKFSK